MNNSKIGQHISEQFNKELEDIRNKVLSMGGLVERQIELTVQAFTKGDMELAEQVIKQDNLVDEMEMAIDLECTQILALRQPTAFNLRLLITRMMEDPRNITQALDVLWTVRALERIGDLSRYICEHLVFMIKGEDVGHLSQIELERKVKNTG